MAQELHSKMSVRVFTDQKCFGPGLAELLRRVEEHRSLRAAAQSMKMAYSKAWTVLHTAEDALGFKLLELKTGGQHGGGATLTAEGRQMLAAYERYCARLRDYGDAAFREEFAFYFAREGQGADRMEIRRTTEADLPQVMQIYAYARRFMAEHGNPNQWGPTGWPPEALIRSDIAAGGSYVCVSGGEIVGTFFFAQGKDVEPTYAVIEDGQWLDDSPYGVVHRLAGSGARKGVGAFCLSWAFAQCGHLRIDTHGDNKVLQSLLGKLGFVHCGTIHVTEDNYPRLAYEKISKTE